MGRAPIGGWLRTDGRKGIRNYLLVAYLVECAHHVARDDRRPVRRGRRPADRLPRLLSEPLRPGHDGARSAPTRTSARVLLVSLGCESSTARAWCGRSARAAGRSRSLVIQELGGTRGDGRRRAAQWVAASALAEIAAGPARADGARRPDRRHQVRRLGRDQRDHRQPRDRRAPSTCWSTPART